MEARLYSRLSAQNRQKAKELFINYKPIFDEIKALIEGDYKSLDKEVTIPPKNVDQWALQQAYLRGQQAAYQQLIKYFETSND